MGLNILKKIAKKFLEMLGLLLEEPDPSDELVEVCLTEMQRGAAPPRAHADARSEALPATGTRPPACLPRETTLEQPTVSRDARTGG